MLRVTTQKAGLRKRIVSQEGGNVKAGNYTKPTLTHSTRLRVQWSMLVKHS
jgi:hypothetical protein